MFGIARYFTTTMSRFLSPVWQIMRALLDPFAEALQFLAALGDINVKAIALQFMRFETLQDRLILNEPEDAPSVTQRTKEQAIAWLEAGDWDALDHGLSVLDRSNAAAPSGRRLSKAVLDGTWDFVTRGLSSYEGPCGDTLAEPFPLERLTPFIDAAHARPDSSTLGGLVAWLCMQVGWTVRGSDYAETVSDAQFQKMDELFRIADGFLDRFDPEEVRSPLLARLRYHRIAGIQTTLAELTRAYETVQRLDPDDAEFKSEHGFHLLPRWYGSYEILDAEARKARAATHLDKGATDYATFYIDQMAEDEGALETVDLDLFEEGLIDWFDSAEHPQAVLNVILSKLHKIRGSVFEVEIKPLTVRRKQNTVGQIFDSLVRENLEVALHENWECGREEMFYAIARSYLTEIRRGQTVRLGATDDPTNCPW